MGSTASQKPHAVCLPFPAQGHVTPMMRLAQLLHSRGFYITFVNTEFNHQRNIRSRGPDSVKGLPDFKFDTIPDGLPPSEEDATQNVFLLCDSTRKNCLGPFKELLVRLNSTPEVPPVTCVVADGIMSFGIKAAAEMGIPEAQLWTAPACAFVGALHFRELVQRGIIPFKDHSFMTDGTLDEPVDWIPGMKDIRLKDLPSFMRTTDLNEIMFDFSGGETVNCLTAPAIIFNTFHEFEKPVLDGFVEKFDYPNVYTVGPLSLLGRHIPEGPVKALDSSLWKPDTKVFDWLDQREPDSVIYVNYGSIAVMSDHHFKEFAWGLANSKHHFLWIVRSDVVMGGSTALPDEYMEEIKDRGLLVSWCQQEQVLAHPAVGAFLSHCGWNSTMESVCEGVPIICWPFFGDQQTICRMLCTQWGIGMELDNDVKREEVEAIVKEMMGGEKGKAMRSKARDWKRQVEAATDVGGSSYNDFGRFIKEALHYDG